MNLFLFTALPSSEVPPGGLERFVLQFPGGPRDAAEYIEQYEIGAPVKYEVTPLPVGEIQPQILCRQERESGGAPGAHPADSFGEGVY